MTILIASVHLGWWLFFAQLLSSVWFIVTPYCIMPGSSIQHYPLEFAQIHVHHLGWDLKTKKFLVLQEVFFGSTESISHIKQQVMLQNECVCEKVIIHCLVF